ncbi:ABC transporter ATP-binding protein [Thermosediminibacter oceani]|uniref:Oligopeptide/dipeptide ABC transporter, ATPase subunit n=1 Tax=Thermosediminibacter oceani (strain ATCC BAA-1034 / DSM 16646 / JW/IW-1228P) TaxID=555079 RepID=D9S1W2_THEOJ|nr:ABC transporter ATP-binding protein [Thermosediminibacter oceani]ADL07389.1 oligopeptide/dipeptide ABC transporter, ATPase subunit [Thermosediminibacter oceani DSM 16646]
MEGKILLEVKDLTVKFFTDDGVVTAVDRVSFDIKMGETLGMVGESGCGKSVTSLAIMRLLPSPPAKITSGKILFEGEDLLAKSEAEMRRIRGNRISMIFQEPMTSLNPVFTVGRQISEAIMLHQRLSGKEAVERAVEMLRLVGIPNPEKRYHEYPHQMSGGMHQRVMIAMALSCSPKLLVADEPTTALDVTIQAQILDLINRLKDQIGMSVLLITHDLGVVAETAERVVVMYAGQVVEEAACEDLFESPLHPYTAGLLKSIPSLGGEKGRLHVIEGTVPNPLNMPPGCRFNPRCPEAADVCRKKSPALLEMGNGRRVRCFLRGSHPEEV